MSLPDVISNMPKILDALEHMKTVGHKGERAHGISCSRLCD